MSRYLQSSPKPSREAPRGCLPNLCCVCAPVREEIELLFPRLQDPRLPSAGLAPVIHRLGGGWLWCFTSHSGCTAPHRFGCVRGPAVGWPHMVPWHIMAPSLKLLLGKYQVLETVFRLWPKILAMVLTTATKTITSVPMIVLLECSTI